MSETKAYGPSEAAVDAATEVEERLFADGDAHSFRESATVGLIAAHDHELPVLDRSFSGQYVRDWLAEVIDEKAAHAFVEMNS